VGHALFRSREIPLFLVPAIPFLPNFRKLMNLKKDDLKIPMALALVSVLISLGVLIYQTLIEHRDGSGILRSSIYTSYNLIPAFLLGSILFLSRPTDRFWKTTSIALFLTAFLAIFLTASRGATITAVFIFAVTLSVKILAAQKHRRSLISAGLATVLIFSAIAWQQYNQNPSFKRRYESILHPSDIPSVEYRMQIWDYNYYLFKKNPVFGVGYKNNGMVLRRSNDTEDGLVKYRRKLEGYHAHNIFLQALAESGIVGVALFLGWLFLPILIHPRMALFSVGIALSGMNEATFNNSRVANSVFCFALLSLLFLRSESDVKASIRS
jgi:O-antigen ligase